MAEDDSDPFPWLTDRISESLGWLFAVVALVVTYFGWAFLANSYAISNYSQLPVDEDPMGRFIVISIAQLPNVSSVIKWHLQNRLWLLILIVLAEVAVVGGYFVFKKVEAVLSEPRHLQRSVKRGRSLKR